MNQWPIGNLNRTKNKLQKQKTHHNKMKMKIKNKKKELYKTPSQAVIRVPKLIESFQIWINWNHLFQINLLIVINWIYIFFRIHFLKTMWIIILKVPNKSLMNISTLNNFVPYHGLMVSLKLLLKLCVYWLDVVRRHWIFIKKWDSILRIWIN